MNELILLIVIGLLVFLIATVCIMIICNLRNRKTQEKQLAEQLALRRLELAQTAKEAAKMVQMVEKPEF